MADGLVSTHKRENSPAYSKSVVTTYSNSCPGHASLAGGSSLPGQTAGRGIATKRGSLAFFSFLSRSFFLAPQRYQNTTGAVLQPTDAAQTSSSFTTEPLPSGAVPWLMVSSLLEASGTLLLLRLQARAYAYA